MNDRRIRGLRCVVLIRLVLAIAGLTMVTGPCMSQNEQYAPWDAGLSFPAASDTPQTETALYVDYSAFSDHKPEIPNADERPDVDHAALIDRIAAGLMRRGFYRLRDEVPSDRKSTRLNSSH